MLTTTTKNLLIHPVARIAQSVEQRIENPRGGGAIPPPGTTILIVGACTNNNKCADLAQ